MILSGIEGTTTNSIEDLINLVCSIGDNVLAKVANASMMTFFLYGIDLIFKS